MGAAMPGPQKILIVEDEPLIAMMLEDFLDALDRIVAGMADSVASALELVEAGGIDAAVMRGGETCWPIADALAARGIPFVLATGGAGDMIAEAYRDRPVLSKPFTMDSVEKVLDSLVAAD
jgi:CheY-like chemotaxis protein